MACADHASTWSVQQQKTIKYNNETNQTFYGFAVVFLLSTHTHTLYQCPKPKQKNKEKYVIYIHMFYITNKKKREFLDISDIEKISYRRFIEKLLEKDY